jgi:hypothetical protein
MAQCQRRTFYLGGEAHLHYAPVRSDYLFERPPHAAESVESASLAASSVTAMHQLDGPSTTGAAAASGTALAGGAGGAWMAYESAEFTPLEEVLLDFTAWMIALALCYRPSRSDEELEEDEENDHDRYGRDVRENHMIKRRRRDQSQRENDHRLAASGADTETLQSNRSVSNSSNDADNETAQAEPDDDDTSGDRQD